MSRRLLPLAALAALLAAAPAQAAAGPLPVVKATWADTYLPPGGEGGFDLQVRNIGDAPLGAGFTVTDELPAGVHATQVIWDKHFSSAGLRGGGTETCAIEVAGTKVTCRLDDFDAAMGIGVAPGREARGFYARWPNGFLAFPAHLNVKVAVEPGVAPGTIAPNTATVTEPLTVSTAKDGGPSSNEVQTVAVRATAGQYRLTPTTAEGSGTLTESSKEVTGLASSFGAFHVGDAIAGPGIPTGKGSGGISAGSPLVTYVCPFKGAFAVGQAVSAPGIPPGTTIAKVESSAPPPGPESCGIWKTLTLSAPATESGERGLLADTTIANVLSASEIELSAAATKSGAAALSATETTGPIDWNAPASGAGSLAAALEALTGVGLGGVTVSGGPGDATGSHPYAVAFGGSLAAANLPQMIGATAPTPLAGGNPGFTDTEPVTFSATPAPFGLVPASFLSDWFGAAFPFGSPSRQAGAHPFEQRVNLDFSRHVREVGIGAIASPNGLVKTVEVTLPRGMIGNPEAVPKCKPTDFAREGAYPSGTGCPADTQVGYLNVTLQGGPEELSAPIYSLVPPYGTPIDLAFNIAGLVQGHIYATLDPAQNYAVKTVTPDISALVAALGTEVTVWGVPADPAHDFFRTYPEAKRTGERNEEGGEIREAVGAPWGSAAIRPFFTNPMDCGFENGGSRIRLESYEEPGVMTPVQEYGSPDNVEKCDDQRFRFKPEVAIQPTDRHAGAPTGLDVHLKVPLRSDEVKNAEELYPEGEHTSPEAIATPPIKKAIVTLPEGMTLSPSAAQGLGSCTAEEIGLVSTNPPRFNSEPVHCPDNSQYGTLTIHTPLLPANEQPTGFIYIAKQSENPFHNFLSLYLVIEEPARGVLFKIPGRLDLDQNTGQITTSFDELPQFPVSDMEMSLKGGVRAGLVEPATCGEKTIEATFYTWQDPTTPHPSNSSYAITEGPGGSPCVNSLAERPFKPSFTAGTLNNTAGEYAPFAMRLTRTDEDQEFSQLGVKLPMGLAAKFAGVGICPDSGIAQALAREKTEGAGALEQADPSCPESSQIGTTMVGAGVGVPLSWVPGKVYLAGPYKGAPMSLVVISPAIVGPYDLGVITVRTALYVNPETAQGEALSDPFPLVFQGIPVRIRDIRLSLNRPGFTLNPTSCAEKQIEAKITGTGGNLASTADDTTANFTDRFQAADCAFLGFKPSLSFRLSGGTKRGAHPKLKAVVRMPRGGANIAAAKVTLPHSEFLDQGHIRTVCTRVQFAAHECPAASIYGYAKAKTPLFDTPLEGPVYLRSSSHQLPDLVAALRGPASQPVEVDLDGRIDSAANGGIRNTFELVPDAPVEEFTLEMQGNRKGLLVNSTDLCTRTNRAIADFTAQNGRVHDFHPVVRNSCHKPHGKKGKRGRG